MKKDKIKDYNQTYSRCISTFNHKIKISVSGTGEDSKLWDTYFDKKNKLDKSKFFNDQLERDLGEDLYAELTKELNEYYWGEVKRLFKMKGEIFLKPQWINDVVLRAKEEESDEKQNS